jgi:HK97 family phage major capsid protein
MAITATGTQINRSNIQLPNSVSSEILQKTQEASIIMRLARQIPLPGNGVQIPVIASDPTAEWVTETGAKPVSTPTLDKKIMQAHKLAVIVPFSNEFRRDVPALYNALIARLPGVLAEKFDNTVIFGPASGTLANFDNFSAVTGYALDAANKTVYDGLVAADGAISTAGGIMNGIALAPQGKSVLLSAVDGEGRPLFNTVFESGISRVLGAPVHISKAAYKAGTSGSGATPDVVGIAGDWTHAMYGTVEGVQVRYSADATLTSGNTTINLFQQNMFAVLVEIEVGFVAETDYFAKLTKAHA